MYKDESLYNEFNIDLSDRPEYVRNKFDFEMKTRAQHIKGMMEKKDEYDLLVVGGGATGAGVVSEAASRGLKCALIDSYDFGSGTSSRSTKLAHGGIRYLQ